MRLNSDFILRNDVKNIVVSTSQRILKKENFDTRIHTEMMSKKELQSCFLNGFSTEEITYIAKLSTTLVFYIVEKYKGTSKLKKDELLNLLDSEYLICFFPEKVEKKEEPIDFFGCLLLGLNPIISLAIALYFWYDTKDYDTMVGVFLGCLLFFVPIPMLVLKIILKALIDDKKEEELAIKAASFTFDSAERKEIIKSALPTKTTLPYIVLYAIISIMLSVGAIADSHDLFDGYYMLLRVITCAVCVYSAVKFKTEWAKWIFGGLAVLYNPLLPIHLENKELWSIINIITLIYAWIALFVERKQTKEQN